MIGNKICYFDVLDSTNNYVAKQVFKGEITHGTVVLAGKQLSGKGQRGAQWLSNADENLLVSYFIEHANLSVSQQFNINKLVAISICECLAQFGIVATIKWPNDILVKKEESYFKIAGVLIENSFLGNKLKHSIVGIGLNVNQTEFESLNAISMATFNKKEYDIYEVLTSLSATLNMQFSKLIEGKINEIKQNYLRLLWKYQKTVSFKDNDQEKTGKIIGVDKNGLIELEVNQELKRFDIKSIQFIY